VAIIVASPIGVTDTAPWPMATEIVSPAYHFSLNVLCFHSVEGTRLGSSLGRSIPVFPTSPNMRPTCDAIHAEPVADVVEEHVARLLDRMAHVTVRVRPPSST
jgi:hypothetical protein